MTETAQLNMSNWYVEDMAQGITTASVTRRDTNGNQTAFTRTQINSDNFGRLSAASLTTLGLAGTKYAHDAYAALASGSAFQYASTSQNGQVYRMSAAPASVGQPIAMEENDARIARIVSAAIYNALTGSAQTPDYGNAFVTRYEMQLAQSLPLGSGKDGHGQLGAIAASSTAPTVSDVTQSGLLTGTYTWKIAAYNLSGAIVASSASSSSGAITSKKAILTLPALPASAMGWRVYRSTDGVNWYLVGIAVKGYNYTETASDALQYKYVDNNPTPNTSQSAPGSDTTGNSATLSGLFQFLTFTTTASTSITVANTGNYAGILDIRHTGLWTGAETAWSITATGANAVNVKAMQIYSANTAFTAVAKTGTFTTAASASAVAVVPGLGADLSFLGKYVSGFGTKATANGGYGGGFVRIWGLGTATGTVGGTITVSGAAGTADGGGGGGGGGAGGWIDIGFVQPWKDIGTRTAAGGAGGNSGGTSYGGGGGGGGAVIRRGCYDKASATTSVAAGANGSNGGTSADGGVGGANYGNGAANGVGVSTAGQQFDFNSLFDPMPFVA